MKRTGRVTAVGLLWVGNVECQGLAEEVLSGFFLKGLAERVLGIGLRPGLALQK